MTSERIAGELPADIVQKHKVRFNIRIALKYYRYLRAFCENALDSMEWYFGGQDILAHVASIAKNRSDTLTILAHIDRALDTYRKLCEQENTPRPYCVIMTKYIDPAAGSDGRGKPYTNEELAHIFEVNKRTIERDIREAQEKLSVLFFGIAGIEEKPTG